MIKGVYIILLMLLGPALNGQSDLDQLMLQIDLGNYEKAREINSNFIGEKVIDSYLDLRECGIFPEEEFLVISNREDLNDNFILLLKGITIYLKYGSEVQAFDYLHQSLQLAKKRSDRIMAIESIRNILEIYERLNTVVNDDSYKNYVAQFLSLAYNGREIGMAKLYEYRIGQRYNYKDIDYNLEHYPKYNKLLKYSFKSPLFKAKRDLTHFVFHFRFTKNNDSSLFYLEESFKNLKSATGFYEKERFVAAIVNKASFLNSKGNASAAQKVLDSLSFKGKNNYLFKLLESYYFLERSNAYLTNGDSLNYYRALSRSYLIDLNINQGKSAKEVSSLATKYETAEKEKQILIEQQRATKNRNWLIAATLALLLGSGIAVLLQKNSTKKRQLAEQEAQLKQQRVDNLLKEQELISIDAMITGQEKERQRVAGELHDDLGSLMATIKLHFDNAQVDKKDPAMKNAQKLLEKAYQKVRGIAHSKNSGVMSDQGLLPAIKKMARTISETDALEVTVEDFGLGERMENSLELSIFRMVQELVANTIKHAEASSLNIQLTQHEDNLNIIVEDDGKGFDRLEMGKGSSGMGLANIEKRVEHLEGNFTIDSIPGKGTSILIDIPV